MGRLKYMLLCKIMTSKGDAEEVPAIISSRAGLKYAGGPRHNRHQLRAKVAPDCRANVHSPQHPCGRKAEHSLLSALLKGVSSTTSGDEVDSMAAVAKAYGNRSLQGFQAALDAHREQLAGDPVVHTHLQVRPFSGFPGVLTPPFLGYIHCPFNSRLPPGIQNPSFCHGHVWSVKHITYAGPGVIGLLDRRSCRTFHHAFINTNTEC